MNRIVVALAALSLASCEEEAPDCHCKGEILEMTDATVSGKIEDEMLSQFSVQATVKSRGSAPKGQSGTMTVFVTATLHVTFTVIAKEGVNTVTHDGLEKTFSVEVPVAEHKVGCPPAEFTDTVKLKGEEFAQAAVAQIVKENGKLGVEVNVLSLALSLDGEELHVGTRTKTNCQGLLRPSHHDDPGIGGHAPLTILEDGTIEPTKVVIGNTKVQTHE